MLSNNQSPRFMGTFTEGSGRYRAEGARKSTYREMDTSVDMLIHNRGDSLVPRDHQQTLYETQSSRLLGSWKEHYRSSKKTFSDLESFFLQRAQLEEEFSQRLLGLARQKLGEDETGNLASSLKSVKREVEASAAAHLQLASRIRDDLLQPSSQQATQMASSKRGLISALLPKKQAQSNYLFLWERSKERLQEARQAGGDSSRFGVEQELQLAAARYDDACHHLQAEEERALDGFKQLEVNRIQFIRNTLWKYTNLLSGICVTDDECSERVRGVLEACDAKSEVGTLISSLENSVSSEDLVLSNGPSNFQNNIPAHVEEKQTALPGRGSPLRNEIRKPSEPRFNQLVTSLNASSPLSETGSRSATQAYIGSPASDRAKVISSDLVSATIARSPILAAKRSSTHGRQSSRPNSVGALPHRSNPSSPAAHPPVTNSAPPSESYLVTPARGNSMVERGFASPPDEYFPPSEGLQRSFSGSSQPYARPPYGAQPHYSPQGNNYSGGMSEHIRQRTPSPPSAHPAPKAHGQSCPPSLEAAERPILFYVKAVYDYDAEIPEEIALREGQIIAVLATQLDGWWEGEVQDGSSVRRGIFPSNFTEPVSL